MSELDATFAAIDRLVGALDDPDRVDHILSYMEDAAARPRGLVALAERYGASEQSELLRPLSFLVARSISRDGPADGAAIALQLIETLRSSDDSTRSNLATAVHLLAMHRVLPAGPAPPYLGPFLLVCLRGAPVVRDAAVPALASLVAAGVRFSDAEHRALRAAVELLREENPGWVAAALKHMND